MIFEPIYPHLSGATDRRQADELQSYLYQLVDRLEYAFNDIEKSSGKDRTWTKLGLSRGIYLPSFDCGRAGAGCFFRCRSNHVYVAFNCAFSYLGSALKINSDAIPVGYRPKRNVYSMCAADGRRVARVYVDYAGNIFVDWLQELSSSGTTSNASVNWIDGYIDYWI